ncbi:MAG TPA: hypothetical protein PLN31_09595 [Azoarcus taiwanensis]|nr:hypothetical protein [Azoarcus taiwanensis]
MDRNSAMIWAGQGPVQVGTYDPVNGRADSGFLVDLYRIGCGTSQLNTNISRSTKDIQESCTGQKLTLKQLETGKTMAVSLAMVQFSGRTLAAALFGEALEVAGGTVTGEALPPLAAGDYFTLRHPKVSDVVIKDSTTPTALDYVAATHYEIEDADHARVKLLAHPASHEEPVVVDYTYGGYVNIAAFSKTNVERGIVFNGVNQDGQKGRLIIPRIALALDGDFSWINTEEATLTLSGNALFVPELESDGDYGGFARVSLFD